MMKNQLLRGAMAGLALATSVQAKGFSDDRWYIAPFGSYLHPGGDRAGLDGWGAGGAVGKTINEYFNIELRGFWQNYSNDVGFVAGQTDLGGGTVDLQYYFSRDTLSPYVVTAIGGMNTSARFPGFGGGYSEASFIFETGLGATYELAENFLLRADARYRLDTLPSTASRTIQEVFFADKDVLHDLVVNIGFVVPFGDRSASTKVEAVAAAPADDCAGRDSDHDGVNDCDDQCPGTMSGTQVDDQGCPIRIELKGVHFGYDSANLTESAKLILNEVAEELVAFPEKKDIEVAGHTSTEGTNAYNLRLSRRRSAAVADYLKRRGVTNKLHPKGYGEEYPAIQSDNSESERQKNRRVELIWMGD